MRNELDFKEQCSSEVNNPVLIEILKFCYNGDYISLIKYYNDSINNYECNPENPKLIVQEICYWIDNNKPDDLYYGISWSDIASTFVKAGIVNYYPEDKRLNLLGEVHDGKIDINVNSKGMNVIKMDNGVMYRYKDKCYLQYIDVFGYTFETPITTYEEGTLDDILLTMGIKRNGNEVSDIDNNSIVKATRLYHHLKELYNGDISNTITKDIDNEVVRQIAIRNNHFEMIDLYIECGFDPHILALEAIRSKNLKMVTYLLEKFPLIVYFHPEYLMESINNINMLGYLLTLKNTTKALTDAIEFAASINRLDVIKLLSSHIK